MSLLMVDEVTRTALDPDCWFDHGVGWVEVVGPADRIEDDLMAAGEGAWETGTTFVYGKHYDVPRMWQWAGLGFTPESRYIEEKPAPPMSAFPWLTEIEEALADKYGRRFNSCLLNLYPTGWHSVGWHFDACMLRDEVVAGVSFGGTRRFRLRPIDGDCGYSSVGFDVGAGDLFSMGGETQHRWQHSVPKTTRDVASRLSLTFRTITH